MSIATPHTQIALPRAPQPEKEWLSRKEAARYLLRFGVKLTPKTLANLASNQNAGNGPSFTRDGWKTVQYRPCDLEAWAKARRTEIRSR
jgi:hypothetical protein